MRPLSHARGTSMEIIQQLYKDALRQTVHGQTANYIPALQVADASQFAVSLLNNEQQIAFGNTAQTFTLQSVVKVLSFMLAADAHGIEKMMRFVDVEPTGDSFNSIVRLESKQPKPFNPMINAGAITVASLLPGASPDEKVEVVTNFLQVLLQKPVRIHMQTYVSEYESADNNRAIAYMLKANGFLNCDVEDALQTYLQLCSIAVNVEDLAKIALFFATDGQHSTINPFIIKVSKALMLTCGMYNASGKFAAFVGLPAKSGVSGAIIAVIKHGEIDGIKAPIGIGLYGPAIDEVGNSVAGVHFLVELVKKYNIGIF